MHVLWGDIGEDNSGGGLLARPCDRRFLEIAFAKVGKTKEPENGVGNVSEDAQPGAEGCGFNLNLVSGRKVKGSEKKTYLIKLVEVAKDDSVIAEIGE